MGTLKNFVHLLGKDAPNMVVCHCFFETNNYFYNNFNIETGEFSVGDEKGKSHFPEMIGGGFLNKLKVSLLEKNVADLIGKGLPINFDMLPLYLREELCKQVGIYNS